MNSYLYIAEQILEMQRKPMSAISILHEAYRLNLLPSFLYGNTQHKTLQARLSEDILKYKEKSLFYRVKPGVFFLSKFLKDETINQHFRQRYLAKRRSSDLYLNRYPVVCIHKKNLPVAGFVNSQFIKKIIKKRLFLHANYKEALKEESIYIIKCFSCLWYKGKLLTYRPIGKRNKDYDYIKNRCIGFSSYLTLRDLNLFNLDTYGIEDLSKNLIWDVLNLNNSFDTIISSNDIKFCIINNKNHEILVINYIKINNNLDLYKDNLPVNNFKWFDPHIEGVDMNGFDEDSKKILIHLK